MTMLEFWGCSLLTFGPALVMFNGAIADNPIKIIMLILAAFFWLLSFLLASILWAIISKFCNYLLVGAYLAAISQEMFRFLFHRLAKVAQVFLNDSISYLAKKESRGFAPSQYTQDDNIDRNQKEQHGTSSGIDASTSSSSSRPTETRTIATGAPNDTTQIAQASQSKQHIYKDILPIGYVSGLGFGLMSATYSMANILADHTGPGTVGLKGDSSHFLLVSSVTTLAFIFLHVAWSVMISVSIEKPEKRLAGIVLMTHLTAITITLFNQLNLQLISVIAIYLLTALCGLLALKSIGIDPRLLLNSKCSVTRPVS